MLLEGGVIDGDSANENDSTFKNTCASCFLHEENWQQKSVLNKTWHQKTKYSVQFVKKKWNSKLKFDSFFWGIWLSGITIMSQVGAVECKAWHCCDTFKTISQFQNFFCPQQNNLLKAKPFNCYSILKSSPHLINMMHFLVLTLLLWYFFFVIRFHWSLSITNVLISCLIFNMPTTLSRYTYFR